MPYVDQTSKERRVVYALPTHDWEAWTYQVVSGFDQPISVGNVGELEIFTVARDEGRSHGQSWVDIYDSSGRLLFQYGIAYVGGALPPLAQQPVAARTG